MKKVHSVRRIDPLFQPTKVVGEISAVTVLAANTASPLTGKPMVQAFCRGDIPVLVDLDSGAVYPTV